MHIYMYTPISHGRLSTVGDLTYAPKIFVKNYKSLLESDSLYPNIETRIKQIGDVKNIHWKGQQPFMPSMLIYNLKSAEGNAAFLFSISLAKAFNQVGKKEIRFYS